MKKTSRNPLSADLRPIYDLELHLGNEVVRVDRPAGSACPLAVICRDPLHFAEIKKRLSLPESVSRWSNDDAHYPSEAGFSSSVSGHAIAGPSPKRGGKKSG
jgi:hypothetical protein